RARRPGRVRAAVSRALRRRQRRAGAPVARRAGARPGRDGARDAAGRARRRARLQPRAAALRAVAAGARARLPCCVLGLAGGGRRASGLSGDYLRPPDARLGTALAATFGAAPCAALLGGFFAVAASAGRPFLARLALSASIRSITCGRSAGAGAAVTSRPSTLRS